MGGHVRDWHRCLKGEYALASSRFTKTAHPACSPPAPVALGCMSSPEPKFSPPNSPLHGQEAHLPEMVSPESRAAAHVCLYFCPSPPPLKTSCRLGRIVKEAASRVVNKVALAQPCEPRGRPRTGTRGEGTLHFSPSDGWGLRKLAAKTQGQAYPPGGCGLLRLNSRVGGGQTTQPWVSPDTAPPSRLVGTCPEPQRARTGRAGL